MAHQVDEARLTFVLLALLPKGGEAVTASELASIALVTRDQVRGALMDAYLSHQVDYDLRADAYSARKRGDAL